MKGGINVRVKIGDIIHDSNNEPIMLILDGEDIDNISNMEGQKKYCSYPEDMSADDIVRFMKD